MDDGFSAGSRWTRVTESGYCLFTGGDAETEAEMTTTTRTFKSRSKANDYARANAAYGFSVELTEAFGIFTVTVR